MKKLYTLLTIVILTASAMAQAPERMSYQAVVRDAGDALVTTQTIGMQISILQGSITGTAVYVETQNPSTNVNGLVSIEIGSGTVVLGTFNSIDWSNGPYFIKTETDPTGSTTYTITGTSQLMSVPYALHSTTADSIVGGVSLTETDPVYAASVASNIMGVDTTNWGNHTVDTDTQLDSAGVAALGFVAGSHTVNTDTQLDSSGVAALGYVAGPHTDSTAITNMGFVAGLCGLSIGDTYAGGIIFYLDATGCHGLVCASTDQSNSIVWNNGSNLTTYAYGNGIGSGDGNAGAIRRWQGGCASCYAAEICYDLTISVYNDWYLPSKYELNLMYENIGQGNALGLGNVGGFSNEFYWSSTEVDDGGAWAERFSDGIQGLYGKTDAYDVRAVRAF